MSEQQNKNNENFLKSEFGILRYIIVINTFIFKVVWFQYSFLSVYNVQDTLETKR